MDARYFDGFSYEELVAWFAAIKDTDPEYEAARAVLAAREKREKHADSRSGVLDHPHPSGDHLVHGS